MTTTTIKRVPLIPLFLFVFQVFLTDLFARESIALADLSAQGVTASDAAIISDRVRNEMFAMGTVSVLERSQMDQILKEQGFQQQGCTSDACAVEAGQVLGVRYMAVGSVGLLGKTYTMNVRLIDVKTGQIVRSAAEDCKCEIDDLLKRSVPKITRQLLEMFQPVAQKAPVEGVPEAGKAPAGGTGAVTGAEQGSSVKAAETPQPAASAGQAGPAAAAAGEKHKKMRLVPRIACGAGAVLAFGAGLYFNHEVDNEVGKRNALRTEYINGAGSMDKSSYLSRSQTFGDNAKRASQYRAVSYIIAGLGAVGFSLTFVF